MKSFRISLDNLIKGDLEIMKKEIDTQEYAKFQKESVVFTVLFIALLVLPVPLVMLWKWFGIVFYSGLLELECILLSELKSTEKIRYSDL